MNLTEVILAQTSFVKGTLVYSQFAYTGSNVTYIGFAPRGSADGDATWTIFKLAYDGDNQVTSIKSSGAGATWTGRASATYA